MEKRVELAKEGEANEPNWGYYVMGVPMSSGAMEGIEALYSIVQMSPGIPVATVGIGALGMRCCLRYRS